MSGEFKYLFTPFKIGSVTVRNRIFSGPHGTNYSDQNHILDERYVEYQRARAKGGAGLIIAGQMNVMFNCRNYLGIQEIFAEEAVPMLRQLAEAVHKEGAKLFVQLCHTGRRADPELTRLPAWAPSPIMAGLFREVPKEMEVKDIKEVVRAFAKSAGFAKEAGLDGVELHGASGDLLLQFMSPWSNKRLDEYGGSLEKRMRLHLEVIDAIREAVGRDFVVGIRLPGEDLLPGGNTLNDMKEAANSLEAMGKIDFIHVGGSFPEGFFYCGYGHACPLRILDPLFRGIQRGC